MKNDSSLNEKGAKLAADLRDYFQQGNVCDSLICLAAQDYYLDNLPDGFTAEQGLAFFFGNQGTLTMHPTTPGWITPVGVMASPDRMLTKGQQQTAFENLERLTMSYIVKKNVECESKGGLNERSTSRLAIAHRLHAYSRVLKNPDLYKALADNQRRNNEIIRDNPAVGQSGGFPSM